MTKEESIADWKRMYNALTDPHELDEAKRRTERTKRREEKIADTGYVL